jgi:cytochrome c oxidase subunit 1
MNNLTETQVAQDEVELTRNVGVVAFIATFVLLVIAGLLLRGSQAGFVTIGPDVFYRLMTFHGAGMVGVAGLGGAIVLWSFLRQHVFLATRVFQAFLAINVVAVALIVGSIFIGGFAAAWTFLYPLPAKSLGLWSAGSSAVFVVGLTLIGIAHLLLYGDAGLAILRRYKSLASSLGVAQLINGRVDEAPPPTVVASTMVIIINVLGIVVGAVVLVMTLVNLIVPGMAFDALLMKNLIFFFGHVFINASIYMAIIAVYELLPTYTKRPWKVSRAFLGSWLAGVFLVTSVYPHHLLMDGVMPGWALGLGQIASYLSGVPVLAVTAWGVLANIDRSGLRWSLTPALLVLGAAGWAMGVVPAIIDGTIVVNRLMHNTLWVPGHFHMYLLMGLMPILFGYMLHYAKPSAEKVVDRIAFWAYAAGALVLCVSFLYGGANSVPRRFALHDSQWSGSAAIGSIAAALAALGLLWIAYRVLSGLTWQRVRRC